LNRRQNVELFEQFRREYEHGVGTIKGVARKFGMHRRAVRVAIANAVPPPTKAMARERLTRYGSDTRPVRGGGEFGGARCGMPESGPRAQAVRGG
jgi:hypothetical protein